MVPSRRFDFGTSCNSVSPAYGIEKATKGRDAHNWLNFPRQRRGIVAMPTRSERRGGDHSGISYLTLFRNRRFHAEHFAAGRGIEVWRA